MKKYFVLLIMTFMWTSCNKFLVEDSRSSQTLDSFYKTEDEAQLAVNAIYAFLYPQYTGGYDDMPWAMLEMITGRWTNQSQWPETGFYYQLSNTAGSKYTKTYWSSCYQGIECANLVLDRVPSIKFKEEKKKQSLLGEARFFRAYYYYLLVNIFGNVPLKLTSTKRPSTDGLLTKTPVKEIYEKAIVPDLVFAAANLQSPTPAGNGRVSIGAANALLAKVYLSMAGNPVNAPGAMALARDRAQEVITRGSFSLFQSDNKSTWFDKLNNASFDNLQEHIWDVNYSYPSSPSGLTCYFLPVGHIFNRPQKNQYGGFYPETNFLKSFDPADLRGKHNLGFFFNSFTTDGKTYNFDWAVYKFFDKGVLDTAPDGAKGFPLLRYADVLLTYAESQNEADGSPNSKSYEAVNDIRKRAGLSPIANLSKDDFRLEVWKQRYWELCAEGQGFFDIVRTQKVYDAKQKTFVPIIGFQVPSGAVVKQGYLPFPIPETEVQINPLLKN